ncbi:MAG: MarC family protein [Shewanella sp.]|nr:MarC family protein [Shewanella sp.]
MNQFYTHLITVFLGFFAIMNPIANTAAFAALAGHKSKAEQFRIAFKALTTAFCVIFVFSILGKTIFHLFGITLTALKITGGILIFLVGYHMLNGDVSKLHTAERSADSDIAISPLAVPLLAGPGTISAAMNYSASGGLMGITVTISVFAFLCIITFLCFISSAKILEFIGQSGLGMITRLMGLILAVIGTQMVVMGITPFTHISTVS